MSSYLQFLFKKIFDFIEEALFLGADIILADFTEAAQCFLLLFVQLSRHNYLNANQLITALTAAQAGNTLPLQAQHLTGLSAFGNLNGYLTIQRRNLDLSAQGCLYDIDRYLAQNSSAITFKNLCGFTYRYT